MTAYNSSPTHLSIFVSDPDTGRPVARLPIYAEVSVPRIIPVPPINARYREPIYSALFDVDPDATNPAIRDRVEIAALQALAETIDEAGRNQLLGDFQLVRDLFWKVFSIVLDRTQQQRLGDIPPSELKKHLAAALREAAPGMGLGLTAEVEETTSVWSDPLGVLTTDHVGYASFDLKRLRPDVQILLAQAIEMRRADPDAELKLAIWIYPYGNIMRYNVLTQARFSTDAIVARIAMTWNTLPPSLINMGPRSLQNPSLTDWRLSPASFAASPKTLLGENGCEELVPSNLALQEFVLRQVVRLTDVPPNFNLPAGFKGAYVDEYKVSWFSLGHSLGEILYSLPLAPGETVKLAVIDWSWDSLTKRDETTKLTEEVLHQTHRDRTITETVKAGLQEMQHGSSFMGGMANSVGGSGSANLGVVGLGAAAGNTWSFGGATASSDGSRDLAAENVQRLNDNFSQASSSQRELNSTVVIQARQEEKESIQTRTFSNYNHSHTLTVLYYQVLRHYRVTVEWVRRRPAVLAQIPTLVTDFNAATIIGKRALLEPNLLDPSLKPAFDLLEKQEAIRAHQTLHGIAPSDNWVGQHWEGDFEFHMFQIGIKTTKGTAETASPVVAYVITAEQGIHEKKYELLYVYKGTHIGGMEPHNLNSGPRFDSEDAASGVWMFVKPFNTATGQFVTVKWKDIVGFQFEKWGTDHWRIDFLQLDAFGLNGLFVPLTTPEVLRDVDLVFEPHEPSSQAFTWINRPAPPPPMLPPPHRTPEKQLTMEEYHLVKKLTDHFANNKNYYNRILVLGTDANSIAIEMETKPWGVGKFMADHVDPTPLEVFGSYVAYPLAKQITGVDDTVVVDIAAALNGNDPMQRQAALDRLAAMNDADRQTVLERLPFASIKSERLNTLPTRGVFAEGKLGHCNVSEEIDNTRFWKWDEHPIPIEAPGINPVTPIQPQPQQVSAASTPFPQSLVNIVNPSPAPDPTGLSAALTLLGTPNIFRDMSGRQEVADLLKKLSDNSIAIAEAANRAREIQAKYGSELDKHEKDLALGQTQAGAEVVKAAIQQRREDAHQVTPSQAQDAIKVSEAEKRKGNKTPQEHADYSKQVQQNIKGAKPGRKSKEHIKMNVDIKGYGNNLIIGRFGIDVKQKGATVGFLTATDYSRSGQLEVGVTNEYDDPRYSVEIYGEVLGGLGINAELRGRDIVQIPREDFDVYDYFYLIATAEVEYFDYETTSSDEVTAEVAKRIGGGVEGAYKNTITIKTEGGVEWKDGKKHTSQTAVKVKVAYYKGGFTIAYVKKT